MWQGIFIFVAITACTAFRVLYVRRWDWDVCNVSLLMLEPCGPEFPPFSCAGLCVEPCDGVEDCDDGSDEAVAICGTGKSLRTQSFHWFHLMYIGYMYTRLRQGRNHGWKVEKDQGSDPNAKGPAGCWVQEGVVPSRCITTGKFLKTQMLIPAFWWLLAVKFLAFWKLRPRSWGTNCWSQPKGSGTTLPRSIRLLRLWIKAGKINRPALDR